MSTRPTTTATSSTWRMARGSISITTVHCPSGPPLSQARARPDEQPEDFGARQHCRSAAGALRHRIRSRVDRFEGAFAHDFSGSYGNTFQAKIGTALPVTNQFLVLPAVTTSLGDHNYMQSWYGVSEFQSLATGKPVFNAHSGIELVGTTVDALYRFAPNLALVGRGGCELSRLQCRQEPGHRAPRPDDDRPRPLLSLQIDVLEGDQARLSPLAGLEPAAASRARRAHSPRLNCPGKRDSRHRAHCGELRRRGRIFRRAARRVLR